MEKLFKDLRVLDLSSVLAGPSVATFFAELGAQVIKIENPLTNGDVTRSWKLASESTESNVSAYFSAINYNKEYRWLNISDENKRSELEDLIKTSDIVIVNFKHGDDLKFRLTFVDIQKMNPRIIYARITGFNSMPERVAYDVVLQAETGYMHMNGDAEGGPLKMPVAMMDVLAAHQLKEGILCALYKREKTGKGSYVECSLEKAGLSGLVNQASNYLMAGAIPKRMGSLHPNIAPYGETFACADGKEVVLAVGSDKQFQQLCSILGNPSIAHQTEFASNQERVANRANLFQELSGLFKAKSREEWMGKFIALNIPAGAIRSMDEVMVSTSAKEMILEETIEGMPTRRMSSVAFSLD